MKGVEFPPETRARFLAALALTGRVSGADGAAERAEIAVPTLYAWRNRDEDFAKAWDEAKAMRREILAEKGLNAIEKVVEDPNHKDHFPAAKFLVDRAEPAHTTETREGADDGIAEAIDRFTSLVNRLAQSGGTVREVGPGAAELAPPESD